MPLCYYSFDLRQLVSFAEIARLKSFSLAANSLHIAQPALSRQIQTLEQTLGVVLFDRNNRRVSLTESGEKLKQEVEVLVKNLENIKKLKLHSTSCVIDRPLRIGDAGGATAEILVPALRKLRLRYPKVQIDFRSNSSAGFFQDLLNEEIDCAFPMLPPQPKDCQKFVSYRILTHRIGVVLPSDHPLAHRKSVPFSLLAEENWILFHRSANPVMYDEIIGSCREAGFSPRIVDQVSPRQRAVALVACGVGITTMTEQRKHLCLEGTVFRSLRDPQPKIDCFVCAKKVYSHPLVSELMDICREDAKDFQPRMNTN
jgi:DNA-binding transcriptional LysR family regulator